jgi:hypothetical protein
MLRNTLKEIFDLLTKYEEFPFLLANELFKDDIKALIFLTSNDLWVVPDQSQARLCMGLLMQGRISKSS